MFIMVMVKKRKLKFLRPDTKENKTNKQNKKRGKRKRRERFLKCLNSMACMPQ